jgi:hypothetical protein
MTGTRKRKAVRPEAPSKEARRAPKQVAVGARRKEHRTARQEEALKLEREEYRHGGIPAGSDPRE